METVLGIAFLVATIGACALYAGRMESGIAGRRRHVRLLCAMFVVVPLAAACGESGPSFEVGDCVRIEERALDSDLEAVDCAGAVGTFDPTARIYKVNEILGNTDGGCPELQGFFPVEFVHEPDGVTYCLVQES